MYNPFPLLNEPLLNAEVAKGKRYFVRQSFYRGMDARIRAALLIRAYPEEEKNGADQHLAAVSGDANAWLYDAAIGEHLEKLHVAARQPFGFKVFYAAKKGLDWKPPVVYEEKMKRYIRHHHAEWRTKRGGEKIQIGLYEEFGELFLKFSYEGEQDTLPFDDIEKY
jgi:hypothetical protein